MKHIYGNHGPMADCQGMSAPNMENKFVNGVVETIIESLEIPYDVQSVFRSLIKKVLMKELNNNNGNTPGMLQQYQEYTIESCATILYQILEIPSIVQVNKHFHPHMSFTDIAKHIDKRIDWKIDPDSVLTIEEKNRFMAKPENVDKKTAEPTSKVIRK